MFFNHTPFIYFFMLIILYVNYYCISYVNYSEFIFVDAYFQVSLVSCFFLKAQKIVLARNFDEIVVTF